MNNVYKISWHILTVFMLLMAQSISAIEFEQSEFDKAAMELKYQYTSSSVKSGGYNRAVSETIDNADDFDTKKKLKSPGKAMLLSMLIPGLGQYYYGSRVKPFLFLGTEITTWVLHGKWQRQGSEATDAYEDFNHLHWSRDTYEQKYLLWSYGLADDELITATEVSHRLPNTETQQFFEMTGKYNQFSWGWDDAGRNDSTLDMYNPGTGSINSSLRVNSDEATAITANRMIYEGMRHDANKKYDKARKMIIASIINRMISGFEAYFVTKNMNKKKSNNSTVFSNMIISPSLRTYSQPGDTPYLKLAYSF